MLLRMWRKRNPPPLQMVFELVQPSWKSILRFLRKNEIDLPEDTAIPLLVIYPRNSTPCDRDICSTMFMAALFVIVRSRMDKIYVSFTQCNTN